MEAQNVSVTTPPIVTLDHEPSLPSLSHVTDVTAKDQGERKVEVKLMDVQDVGEV